MSAKLLDAINTVGANNAMRLESLTGGEHTASSNHYKGTAADIVPSADKPQWPSIVLQFTAAGCSPNQTFCDYKGRKVDCSQANHIHVTC
jgi:hypothetical protein